MSVFCWFAVMSYKNPKIPHFFLFLCIICLMEFTALYRKYRPQKFDDVVGQDHIVSVLEGAVKRGEIAHAYLFSGTRGTGKTSVARILAKEIKTTATDLVEIDAASNTSVEDVRSLNESVHSLPFESKYKVYIIDEVHMLSKSAFNALLKTLEEPPKHVVFILATTEMEKLPDTVVSRCQAFVFRKPTQKILSDQIRKVSKKEGYTIEDDAAELIALLGDGSFRDALGILQKVMSATEKKTIDAESTAKVTGAPSTKIIGRIISGIANKNADETLGAVKEAVDANTDMKTFLKILLHKMRLLLLLKYAPEMKETIKSQLSGEEYKEFSSLASDKAKEINSKTILELLEAFTRLPYAAVPQLPLEIAVINICSGSR